jgi:anti-anti-sigma factor
MNTSERFAPGSNSGSIRSEPRHRCVCCPLVVLRVNEPQMMGDEVADAVRGELLSVYQHSGAVHAVVDMAQVQYLASAGIRCLLGLLAAVRRRGGRLLLCNLTAPVEEVLLVTRLVGSNGGTPAPFEQHPDVRGAVASLWQPAS